MYTHFRIIYCNGAVWVGRGDFLKEWVGSWLWLVGSINCSGYWWVWLEKLKVYIRYEASLLDKLSILQWFQEVIVFNGWGMFDVIGHLKCTQQQIPEIILLLACMMILTTSQILAMWFCIIYTCVSVRHLHLVQLWCPGNTEVWYDWIGQ